MGQAEGHGCRSLAMSRLQWRVLCLVALVLWGCSEFPGEPPQLGRHTYSSALSAEPCPLGGRPGPGGISNEEQTKHGIKYTVRTPANYNPDLLHPLLMVYAPAGSSRFRSERLTGLTFEATTAGFVVAYADSRRLSLTVIPDLGTIPRLIAKKWCVDERRVYLTGHSDGGTVALALALLDETRHIPTAVAPSAAGFRRTDLETFPCPETLSALIMHSANDHLFPGYGAETTAWLAACNECRSRSVEKDENGCRGLLGMSGKQQNSYTVKEQAPIDSGPRSIRLSCRSLWILIAPCARSDLRSGVVPAPSSCYLSTAGPR